MSSLRQFRTALAAAQAGSFTEAGRRIGLTQAAVSLQVRNLEQELGVTLFERGRTALAVTAEGQSVLDRLAQLVDDYDKLCRPDDGVLRGTLLVGALVSALMGSFGNALARIRSDFPELDLRLFAGQSGDFARKVADGELDAAVVAEPPYEVPAGLMWTPFYREPLVLIAHRDLAPAEPLELLRRERFLLFDRSLWTGRLVSYALEQLNVRPDVALELNSVEAIVQLVRKQFGVAIVPHLANAEWDAQQLQVLALPQVSLYRSVGMLERRVHGKQAVTQALCAWFGQAA